jgi:sucrose-6-phosphate hydrolase SacC (GH32 family)
MRSNVLWGILMSCLLMPAEIPAAEPARLYDEQFRPQFHFSPQKNWMNDPNGLVFYRGEYHLFFQHNPQGIGWGNMTWGHAVAADLVHWRQLENAILPDRLGTIFSGSAVVDGENTAGFQTGREKPIVCIYTSAGKPFTQSLAYSNDRGRTWTKYAQNPVLKHVAGDNRDPKVFWHAASRKWIMALFLDGNRYALFGSSNLKDWTKLCEVPVPGAGECPDFFPLPVDGKPDNVKWVFWAANNSYLLGSFDGTTFRKEAGPLASHWGKNRYASQTYSGILPSDGRRIQIAWMAGGAYPGMPFNQQMSFPVTLSLRTFADGVRLCAVPVKEIETLRGRRHWLAGMTPKPGENPLAGVEGELFDLRAEIEMGGASSVGLSIRGTPIRYDCKTKQLACLGTSAPLEPAAGKIAIRVLVDRSSLEIFSGEGRINMAYCILPPAENKRLAVFAEGGRATLRSLEAWELKSIWPK